MPSHGTRAVIRSAAPFIARQALIVSATEGIEQDTLAARLGSDRPGGEGRETDGRAVGSQFCDRGRPRPADCSFAVACADPVLAEDVQREFRAAYFRLYASTDVVGVEIGGALKNIIAIAAGVVEGLGLGQNALAALITRGLAEITRLACAVGGRRETLAGLSGLGDLVLTCTGSLSRNRHVGVELAHGRPISEVVAGMKMVAEGVKTTGAALALGRKHGVELPIATQMAEVLAGNRSAAVAVEELMLRPQKTEQESRYRRSSIVHRRSAGRWRNDDGRWTMDDGRSWDSLIGSGKDSPKPQQQIVQRFDELVTQTDAPERKGRPIDVDTIEALEELLIMADIGVAATDRIIVAVKQQTAGDKSLRDSVKDEIRAIFAAVPRTPSNGHVPHVVLIVGVNGTGKTTTVGKLAQLLKASGKKPLVVAADTFRAAAVEQLEIWAGRAGVDLIRAREGADPAAVVFDGIASGKAKGRDPILVDTAGRLHTKVNLMNELEKIRRVAAREVTGRPA